MKSNKAIVEICCGGFYDAKQAYEGGADRIELNQALYLGGLTPSIASFELVKEKLDIETICMVRPRPAGFNYNTEDLDVIFKDAKRLLEAGASGIAFGFLDENRNIDKKNTEKMVELIKKFGKQVVFHRAFDCVENPYISIETLIQLNCNRVLTSGLKNKAIDGINLLKELNYKYKNKIEILAGSGINYTNSKKFIDAGLNQVHSSCKVFLDDKTTSGENENSVTYSYLTYENKNKYEVVSKKLVQELVESVK